MPAVLWCLWEWEMMTWSFCFLLVLWRVEAVSLVNISVDVPGRKKLFFFKWHALLCQTLSLNQALLRIKPMLFRKLSNGFRTRGFESLKSWSKSTNDQNQPSKIILHDLMLPKRWSKPGDLSSNINAEGGRTVSSIDLATGKRRYFNEGPSFCGSSGHPETLCRSTKHEFCELNKKGRVWWVNCWRSWRFRDTNLT